MNGFDSTRDIASQSIVAAILVGVFALLAADRIHRVLIPIGAVAVIWLLSYFTPFKLISFQAAQAAVARRRGRAFMTRRTKSKCLCSPKGPRRNIAKPGSCF